MQYTPPVGAADPNASYVTGNPTAGIRGSFVPGPAIENPQREIINAILASGATQSVSDVTQLLQAMSKGGIYVGAFGGTSDALQATIPGNIIVPALTAGTRIIGVASTANTTDDPTLAVTGFSIGSGATSIKKRGGGAPSEGDISKGLMSFRFDGSSWLIEGLVPSDFISAATSSNTFVEYITSITEAPAGFPNLLQYSSSGNYSPSSASVKRFAVLCTGPGGPGGSCRTIASGGGGGGECVLAFFNVSDLTFPIPFIIGAPSAPSPTSAGNGTRAPTGSPTTFGNLMRANAGQAGLNNPTNAYGSGSAGGSGSGGPGLLSFPGGPGEGPTGTGGTGARGGIGGGSLRSGGAVGIDGDNPGSASVATNGAPGLGPGAGGGGADPSNAEGACTGGPAFAGEVLVLELV